MSSIKRHWLRKLGRECGILLLFPLLHYGIGPQRSQRTAKKIRVNREVLGDGLEGTLFGLTRPEMEEFLLTAQIVEERALPVGVTNSQRATLDDGKLRHDAHIQTVDIRRPLSRPSAEPN